MELKFQNELQNEVFESDSMIDLGSPSILPRIGKLLLLLNLHFQPHNFASTSHSLPNIYLRKVEGCDGFLK